MTDQKSTRPHLKQNTAKSSGQASLAESRRASLTNQPRQPMTMADLLAQTGYQIPTLRRGQEVTGKIILITPSEILIEIGAKSEGIVTGRELTALGDLSDNLSVGDQVTAVVAIAENDAGQTVLSLRKLSGEKRWGQLEEKKNSQEEIEVVALEVNRGGIICDYSGLRGFLPASQVNLGGTASPSGGFTSPSGGPASLSADSKLEDLIGKKLTVQVIEVDRATNRLIFSQKQPDQRDLATLRKLLSKVQIGQKYPGVVTAVLPFGIFVEIEIGTSSKNKPDILATQQSDNQGKLEGLVHISEISWEKVDDPAKMFKVADHLDVMVIAKDETTGRLNLSLKQLATDPFLEASGKYAKDQTVTGIVAKQTAYGVFVTLENGVEGLMHISKIPPNVSYKQGEKVQCLIENVDTRARRISLIPIAKEKPVLYR